MSITNPKNIVKAESKKEIKPGKVVVKGKGEVSKVVVRAETEPGGTMQATLAPEKVVEVEPAPPFVVREPTLQEIMLQTHVMGGYHARRKEAQTMVLLHSLWISEDHEVLFLIGETGTGSRHYWAAVHKEWLKPYGWACHVTGELTKAVEKLLLGANRCAKLQKEADVSVSYQYLDFDKFHQPPTADDMPEEKK